MFIRNFPRVEMITVLIRNFYTKARNKNTSLVSPGPIAYSKVVCVRSEFKHTLRNSWDLYANQCIISKRQNELTAYSFIFRFTLFLFRCEDLISF